eukprot:CAMPEP_0194760212 /NCGR_PEP_ID=MMETSP0323_2-20130528/13162_1 /TAXON_ID=2866 ORGANISM="Crypthecodinium cohnii, Strain Seligo" /NCGR_SAMPLE_ID=MMETSP0323_2 /ASSEMBLY_ACC=CAM_ASM_000346 /LENGTH=55 /DNA_ID=CAMNT_0039681365 /DNA_START=304 /DNA_END=468 /DNA_ORIENTATION=+
MKVAPTKKGWGSATSKMYLDTRATTNTETACEKIKRMLSPCFSAAEMANPLTLPT